MVQVLSEGFALGMVSGLACAGSCAPFVVPYLMMDGGRDAKKAARLFGQFLLGRFFAYAFVGALAGLLSQAVRPYVSLRIQAVMLIVTSIFMIAFALRRGFQTNPLCSFLGKITIVKRFPFFLGLFLGLNVCPPFLVALARLLEMGGLVPGVLYFSAFFVATTIYLLPLFIVLPFLSTERMQRIGQTIACLVGAWFFSVGIRNLF